MAGLDNGSSLENKPNIPGADDFKQVVQESAQKIAEVGQPQPKITRGRGRPRKDVNASAPPPQPAQGPGPSMAPGATPPPDLTEMLVMPVAIIGEIPARRLRMPELALEQREAIAIASSLNGILQAFIPDLSRMSPKTAAIFTASITIGSVALGKYAIYAEKMSKIVEKPAETVNSNLKIATQPVQTESDAPPMPPGGVSAMDVMRRDR